MQSGTVDTLIVINNRFITETNLVAFKDYYGLDFADELADRFLDVHPHIPQKGLYCLSGTHAGNARIEGKDGVDCGGVAGGVAG